MRRSQSHKLLPLSLLTVALGVFIYWIAPSNVFIISLVIGIVSLLCLYIASFFTSNKRDHILVAFFGGMMLFINWLAGFDPVNILLLASFIIGLKVLLK